MLTEHTFCALQTKSTTDLKYCINEIKTLNSRLTDLRNENHIDDIIKCAIELNTDLMYTYEEKVNFRRVTYKIIASLTA